MAQTDTQESELASAPIGRLLFKMALPCITAQIINALYNIADILASTITTTIFFFRFRHILRGMEKQNAK